ncbi:MAG: Gfo/Idh/MocA family oxidoreductase [Planctomycetes bacterium]|nr:Gfo/Idh/MocA family oxidoreductase [Planctomycetota bacterium]
MSKNNEATRRNFMSTSSALTTAILAQQVLSSSVHAEGKDIVKVALVGCGGRGTGAASQILKAHPSVKLWAMGDLFSDRLESSLDLLQKGVGKRYDREAYKGQASSIDVPPERRFNGFDAYQKAIDSGVDAVILATTPLFRPLHLTYAVAKNVNAFIEKPVAVDAPGVRTILEASKEAARKKVIIASGYQRFHNPVYQEAIERIHNGEIGKLSHIKTYFNHGATWHIERKPEWSEMEFQMRNWQHFGWTSGDHTCDQQAHSFQVAYWLMGKPPVSAVGMGGRQVCKGQKYGNIYDHFATEFTYDDGVQLFAQDRQIDGCKTDMSEWIHGLEGMCEIRQYRGATMTGKNQWRKRDRGHNAYQIEHNVFIDAIRNNKYYNEGEMAGYSTMMSVMARMACYSGVEVKWDEALASNHRLGPIDCTWNTKPPLTPGKDGTYEHLVPVPGVYNPYKG